MKKMLALFLVAAMMLVTFAACSNEKAPSTSSTPQAEGQATTEAEKTPETEKTSETEQKSEEPVTINFWHHYSAQSAENETLMNVLIPKFEEENPGYKVNAVSHEWADLHDKILISAQSNTLPDVARLDIAWVPEFQQMGILVALDQEMADFADVTANLIDSAMSTGFVNGNYYAMALNTNTKIMFYNAKALADAGLEIPATMDEFKAAAEALSGTNENGQQVWGLNEPALAGWNVLPYIWSNGGSITNEDYTKADGYINSDATVAAVQMLADMYQNGQLTGFNSGDIPMTDGFGTNRYMMLLEGPWKTAELAGAYPDFEYVTGEIPAGSAGSISVLGGEDIAMFSSANKEGAWKFMQFMTSPFAEEEMAKCGQIPVNKEALSSETVRNAEFAPFLTAITTAQARPAVAAWSEIDNELSTTMTDIIVNGADVRASLDALAATIDALLAK
ncbi:MAG: extracellular solute-binding protein [Clostridia bacterium]|nr:extracellular solute-binding protein [Clostridia bacterium]